MSVADLARRDDECEIPDSLSGSEAALLERLKKTAVQKLVTQEENTPLQDYLVRLRILARSVPLVAHHT